MIEYKRRVPIEATQDDEISEICEREGFTKYRFVNTLIQNGLDQWKSNYSKNNSLKTNSPRGTI